MQRKCWWDGLEVDLRDSSNEKAPPNIVKLWARRVWTLELSLVSGLPDTVRPVIDDLPPRYEHERASINARSVFGLIRTTPLHVYPSNTSRIWRIPHEAPLSSFSRSLRPYRVVFSCAHRRRTFAASNFIIKCHCCLQTLKQSARGGRVSCC